jgi:hypothetical protein
MQTGKSTGSLWRPSNAPWFAATAIVLVTIAALVLVENALVSAYLPRLSRLDADFSPALLQRRLEALAAQPQVVFMGDSGLWGYALTPDRNAVSILAKEGCRCVNLSFEAGGPPNYYALAALLVRYRVRPALVVLQINQAAFSPADQSYKSIQPSVASLAAELLTNRDRAALDVPALDNGMLARAARRLSSWWLVYGARADLRAQIVGDTDVLPKKAPSADDFLGTYDLSPLDESNVGVRYLEKAVDLLRAQGIPIVAFLTPTNHALLHEYIDVPAYAANAAYLEKVLERRGVRVIDLDRAVPAGEFFDNVHLTARGQRRLAAVLARSVPELGVKRPGE